jgi:hypothetical protein
MCTNVYTNIVIDFRILSISKKNEFRIVTKIIKNKTYPSSNSTTTTRIRYDRMGNDENFYILINPQKKICSVNVTDTIETEFRNLVKSRNSRSTESTGVCTGDYTRPVLKILGELSHPKSSTSGSIPELYFYIYKPNIE